MRCSGRASRARCVTERSPRDEIRNSCSCCCPRSSSGSDTSPRMWCTKSCTVTIVGRECQLSASCGARSLRVAVRACHACASPDQWPGLGDINCVVSGEQVLRLHAAPELRHRVELPDPIQVQLVKRNHAVRDDELVSCRGEGEVAQRAPIQPGRVVLLYCVILRCTHGASQCPTV